MDHKENMADNMADNMEEDEEAMGEEEEEEEEEEESFEETEVICEKNADVHFKIKLVQTFYSHNFRKKSFICGIFILITIRNPSNSSRKATVISISMRVVAVVVTC